MTFPVRHARLLAIVVVIVSLTVSIPRITPTQVIAAAVAPQTSSSIERDNSRTGTKGRVGDNTEQFAAARTATPSEQPVQPRTLGTTSASLFMPVVAHGTAPNSTALNGTNFYGMNWHPIWYGYSWTAAQVQLMHQEGVQRSRMDVPWDVVEPAKGAYSATYLSNLDNAVNLLVANNIKPLLVVLHSPGWANGGQDPGVPPTNNQDYAHFLAFLIQRYGAKVVDYEIWNEPNGSWAWINPSPTRYTALLKTAYTTAKAKNPAVNILAGSLSGYDASATNFLRGMYAAGARGYFNTLSAHAYGDPPNHGNLTPEAMFDAWNAAIPPIMRANGDGAKHIWMTEHGYNTSTGGVSESVQAAYLTRAYAKAKTLTNVDNLFYYEWINSAGGTNAADPEQNYGMIAADGRHKPAYNSYAASALAAP